MSQQSTAPETNPGWTAADAGDLYGIGFWGDHFFSVNERGHVEVRVNDANVIDVHTVVTELVRRNVSFPVLIRFQDILRMRVRALNEAFLNAIREAGYESTYRGIYPIKVNQLNEVVAEVLEAGRPYSMGLECGSKAEFVATLPHVTDSEMLLVCNGIKDRPMLELMLGAQLLDQRVIPVIEKLSEFEDLLSLAEAREQAMTLGVRLRLATPGAGRWAESAGSSSKFGVSIPELLELMQHLERTQRENQLALLHFHLGSQIGNIQVVKQACKEMAQIYAQLHQRGFPVRYLDVGGGLGVNYDVPSHGDHGGVPYGLQEYANAVVYAVKEVCEERGVPVPVLVSESGRALTAHHSVLIVPILGVTKRSADTDPVWPQTPDISLERLKELADLLAGPLLTAEELTEVYDDWTELKRELRIKFEIGFLDIEQLAAAQALSWNVAGKILQALQALRLEPEPPEQVDLEEQLTDQYLGNLSIFQSMLDHWSIGQTFPIMPIHRLDEAPARRGVLVDLTCDSDGKVSRYVSSLEDRKFLPLHDVKPGEPYYLGVFLMGAYQDILGDAHNLFGRVAEAHVYADDQEPGDFWIEKVIPAGQVREMLESVQYFANDLNRRMGDFVRGRIDTGLVRPSLGTSILDRYTAMFNEATYSRLPETDEPPS